ncbi:hypothetical protein IM543_20635 [Massilia sp. UMI-21]|nr:hypothetical protein IM543_20635 [Massilia sp. UMI-21]
MRWSQLKEQLTDHFATSVAADIDLKQTRYRHSHDQEGKFWISSRGNRIFCAGSPDYLSSLAGLRAKNRADGSIPAQAYEPAWPVMDASGMFLLEQMNEDPFCGLSLTVEQISEHNNQVIRALAIIDARYVKRRLAIFDPSTDPPLYGGT